MQPAAFFSQLFSPIQKPPIQFKRFCSSRSLRGPAAATATSVHDSVQVCQSYVSCALRWLNMRSIFSTTQSKRIDLRSRPRPGTTTVVVVVVVVVFLFKSCAGERDRSATSSLDVPKESPALHIVIGTYHQPGGVLAGTLNLCFYFLG